MQRVDSQRRVREMSDTTLAIAAAIDKDGNRQMLQFHADLLK
jgi:hypothetical protein